MPEMCLPMEQERRAEGQRCLWRVRANLPPPPPPGDGVCREEVELPRRLNLSTCLGLLQVRGDWGA